MPNQQGKIFIVTGANAGLGYETTKGLAQQKATVILACRSEAKANAAMDKIKKEISDADLHFLKLDLTDLDSVRSFANAYKAKFSKLDVLINNAGVMIPPYSKTKDGFELQFGVNHLGHFLLTGLLLDVLKSTPNSRIVSLSSLAHKRGAIQFDDLNWEKRYSKMEAYQQSKLACLMFALELQRKLEQANYNTISVAAHPGISPTELARHVNKVLYVALYPLVLFMSHSAAKGALPTLMAATLEGVKGGDYYGPTGNKERKGKAGKARISRRAKDEAVAQRLWEVSEEMVGFQYAF